MHRIGQTDASTPYKPPWPIWCCLPWCPPANFFVIAVVILDHGKGHAAFLQKDSLSRLTRGDFRRTCCVENTGRNNERLGVNECSCSAGEWCLCSGERRTGVPGRCCLPRGMDPTTIERLTRTMGTENGKNPSRRSSVAVRWQTRMMGWCPQSTAWATAPRLPFKRQIFILATCSNLKCE